MAKWLHWGNRRRVVGEPPARHTLTDLSSGLLEPQGKPGWGKKGIVRKRGVQVIWAKPLLVNLDFQAAMFAEKFAR